MTMREKMARAMHALNGHLGDGTPWDEPWDSLAPKHKDAYRKLVDTQLDALMEPTRDMEIAAMEAGDGLTKPDARKHKRIIYQAFIQAAKDGK